MSLKIAKNNLVRKPTQIVGGQRYIEVLYLYGKFHLRTGVVTGRPYKTDGKWFCHQRTTNFGSEYSEVFSLKDMNIIPNCYNLHTLWRFNTATMQWLQGLTTSKHGATEYVTVLAHYGMCQTVITQVSTQEELFDDDPFWQESYEDELMDYEQDVYWGPRYL